jgi:hypothetical protein
MEMSMHRLAVECIVDVPMMFLYDNAFQGFISTFPP